MSEDTSDALTPVVRTRVEQAKVICREIRACDEEIKKLEQTIGLTREKKIGVEARLADLLWEGRNG